MPCTPQRSQALRVDNRVYRTAGHRRFRAAVLARDYTCVLCPSFATVADHYPIDRRELVATCESPMRSKNRGGFKSLRRGRFLSPCWRRFTRS